GKDGAGLVAVEVVLTAGQDVAHDGGQQYAQDGADGGDADGYPQGVQNGQPLAPQVLISLGGEGLRGDKELVALLADHVVVRDGDDEDENDGQEAHQRQDQEQGVEHHVGHRVDPVQPAQAALVE